KRRKTNDERPLRETKGTEDRCARRKKCCYGKWNVKCDRRAEYSAGAGGCKTFLCYNHGLSCPHPQDANPMPTPNWPDVTTETIRHLQALLRLDTTNPPGNEILAAEYLAGVLRAEGFEPLVLESAPGRGNVIARLKGSGEAPPLLLYSHTDVVPAEPA